MNKVVLRWAFCLILFPVVHASAQDAKATLKAAPSSKPDPNAVSGASSPQTLNLVPVSEETSSAKPMEVQEQAPMFPDSLMRNYEVEVFQNVLKMAELANLKYMDVLANAKTGNVGSLYKLLDFNRIVEGVDALNHAVTCLELIPVVGDNVFAAAVHPCSPKMKKVLLERLMLAQVRTKKTFLRQSMTNWAPLTWSYLNPGAPATDATIQPSEQQPATTSPGTAPSGKQ